MAKEYIKREEAMSRFSEDGKIGSCVRQVLAKIPAADVVEVVHGRWEPRTQDDGYGEYLLYFCSECGAVSPNSTRKYCQNCGARMDGKGE